MDTRQAIRREDKKVKRQGQEFEEEKGSPIDIWEDDTRVSVESLRTFLINFVQSQHKEESTETAIHSSEKTMQVVDHNKKEPTKTQTARAVHAYQTIANQTSAVDHHIGTNTIARSEADLIQSEEMRKIYKLIDDLELLSKQGVETLHIERADSFVDSLRNSVLKQNQMFKS